AENFDDDFRRCAGRRFHALGQSRELSGASSALGNRGYRDALAGRADCHRHRPRRDTVLSPRGHDRGCGGAWRCHDRKTRRTVRGARGGGDAPAGADIAAIALLMADVRRFMTFKSFLPSAVVLLALAFVPAVAQAPTAADGGLRIDVRAETI